MLAEYKKRNMFFEQDSNLHSLFVEAGFGLLAFGDQTLFHPLEAAYLVSIGKTSFEGSTLESFVKRQERKDKLFRFAFAVYSHIRSTGRQIRLFSKSLKYFRVYAPGIGRDEERPSHLVCLLPGREPKLKSIEEEVKIAHRARMELIVACGDHKSFKFYKISVYNF
ncbi:MAG: hypothetical protein N3G80_03925 [Candidatus Micrarchaeota archaeon]|nr:hypothetical protein [Candidatus Micrarchaeota archaeon]